MGCSSVCALRPSGPVLDGPPLACLHLLCGMVGSPPGRPLRALPSLPGLRLRIRSADSMRLDRTPLTRLRW